MNAHLRNALVAVAAVGLGACASRTAPADAAEAPADVVPATKISAPVQVSLKTEPHPDGLALLLEVFATRAVPEAHARFVLPPGTRLVDGALEPALGSLEARERRTVRIVVVLPEGLHQVAAGVDAVMSSGVRLHQGSSLLLGRAADADGPTTEPRGPGGEGTPAGVQGAPGAPTAPVDAARVLEGPDGRGARVYPIE